MSLRAALVTASETAGSWKPYASANARRVAQVTQRTSWAVGRKTAGRYAGCLRDPLAIGLAVIAGIAVIPVLVWLFLAVVMSPVGCAWILGFGGCLPR